MVLFDTTMVLLLLQENAPAPLDPSTGKPIQGVKERIEHLIRKLDDEDQTIVIPTPVLSEILVLSGKAGANYIQIIEGSSRFRIAPFDTRGAVQVASMANDAIRKGNKKGDSKAVWAKVKYDRQIVAIGITEDVSVIYSDDKDLRALAEKHHIKAYGIADLFLPINSPVSPQTSFYPLLNHPE
ncbi:MAG: hypothetical protein JNN16_11090 [Nitrospira sp.]|nr:hypothetical protein [Nitrospira sp.]